MHKCYSNCAYMHNYCSSRIWYIYIYIFFFFSLSTSCSLFLSPSDYLSSLIWSFSSSTLFFILSSLKSNNKLSNSSNVNQSRSQIHQALSSIYIYIYISNPNCKRRRRKCSNSRRTRCWRRSSSSSSQWRAPKSPFM